MLENICMECQKQTANFYSFKQRAKRTEKSLIAILAPETNYSEFIVQESLIDCDNDVVEQAQVQLLDDEVDELENSSQEMFETTDEQQNVQIYDINVSDDVVNNSHSDIIIENMPSHVTVSGEINNNVQRMNNPKKNVPIMENRSNESILQPISSSILPNVKPKQKARINRNSLDSIIKYLPSYPCRICWSLFGSKDKLNGHNAKSHPGPQQIDKSYTDYEFLGEDKIIELKSENLYSCGECEIQYPTIDELKYHITSHANTFKCPFKSCGGQYKHLARLCIHFRNKHINTEHLLCMHCNEEFQTYEELRMHIKNDCAEKKFECYECGWFNQITFAFFRSLFVFNCRLYFPGKKFYSEKALVAHMKWTKSKEFKCKTCGKGFKQKGDAFLIVKTFTIFFAVNYFRNFRISQNSYAKSHVSPRNKFNMKFPLCNAKQFRFVRNERPFKCTICTKSYKTSRFEIIALN